VGRREARLRLKGRASALDDDLLFHLGDAAGSDLVSVRCV
jgi:hypothetical protein